MFGKRSRLAIILAASVGIPYVWFNGEIRSAALRQWESLTGQGAPVDIMDSRDLAPFPASATASAEGETTVGQNQLADVLRFDISPAWVTERWPRVSTVRSEQGLEGLRVPLVTGTGYGDIAGSLTYYFDHNHQLQRLTIHGYTADARPLAQLMVSQFGMHAEPNLGAGFYVKRWNGMPTSVLRITYPPVVRADRPRERLVIALEINRPSKAYGLSREFARMITTDRQTQWW